MGCRWIRNSPKDEPSPSSEPSLKFNFILNLAFTCSSFKLYRQTIEARKAREDNQHRAKPNPTQTIRADFKTCNAICIIPSLLWKRIFVMNEKGCYHWNYANTLCDAGRKVIVVEIRNVLRDDASCKKLLLVRSVERVPHDDEKLRKQCSGRFFI